MLSTAALPVVYYVFWCSGKVYIEITVSYGFIRPPMLDLLEEET